MSNLIGIYLITNIVNNHKYVGSSIHLADRYEEHISKLRTNSHDNIYLQRAWNLYGKDSFRFDILLYCSEETLLRYEQFYITFYWDSGHTCYNLCDIAGRPPIHYGHTYNVGRKQTEETKLKKSISMKLNGHIPPSWKGLKRGPVSEEWRQKQHNSHVNQKSCHRKLSEDDVRYIRNNPENLSCIKLARRFNIAKCSILNILHGISYREIL